MNAPPSNDQINGASSEKASAQRNLKASASEPQAQTHSQLQSLLFTHLVTLPLTHEKFVFPKVSFGATFLMKMGIRVGAAYRLLLKTSGWGPARMMVLSATVNTAPARSAELLKMSMPVWFLSGNSLCVWQK